MSTVALVDAGGANLASVRHALERMGAKVRLASDGDGLRGVARAVLPGVGAAGPAMARLRDRGLDVALHAFDRPLLGVCLGMQLLHARSEEGEVPCLGLLPGAVRALRPGPGARVPHMGWNTLHVRRASPWLAGIAGGTYAYFVHGFAVDVGDDCIAESDHGGRFAAVVARGTVAGTQFHPERSGATGARLLRNFLDLPA